MVSIMNYIYIIPYSLSDLKNILMFVIVYILDGHNFKEKENFNIRLKIILLYLMCLYYH